MSALREEDDAEAFVQPWNDLKAVFEAKGGPLTPVAVRDLR